MEFIKKFAKEISVFGLVLVVFLGLFIYRQATYATYKTVSASAVEKAIKNKDDMILVVGPSSDSTVSSYQSVLTEFATKNRKYTISYLDKSSSYLSKTFKIDAATPCTLIINDGKVKAHKSGALQYYYLLDFIKENA